MIDVSEIAQEAGKCLKCIDSLTTSPCKDDQEAIRDAWAKLVCLAADGMACARLNAELAKE